MLEYLFNEKKHNKFSFLGIDMNIIYNNIFLLNA